MILILFKKGLTSTLHYLCQSEKLNASLFCGILDSAEKALHNAKLDKPQIHVLILKGFLCRVQNTTKQASTHLSKKDISMQVLTSIPLLSSMENK